MPLASSGTWQSLGRQAYHLFNQAPDISAHRTIHIPSALPRGATHSQPSHAQRLLQRTRNLVQGFVGHLTTPGTLGNHAAAGRAYHGAAHGTRGPTIQQGLSFTTRYTLAQPLGAPKLPRAPTVPRSVTQVGLGTARNFSSGRPIFQHLAENVSVTGRAFSQLDFDLRMNKERQAYLGKKVAREAKKENQKVQAEGIQFHPAATAADLDAPTSPSTAEREIDHYFPATPLPRVTATLLIPLAPTPTSRLPLPANPASSSSYPFLFVSALSSIHQDHRLHSLRVSTIFARLDVANVWASGAVCDVFGDTRGEASVLRITFAGWDANRVRGVIGESGQGWCVLEEECEDDPTASEIESEIEDVLSQITLSSSRASTANVAESRIFEDPEVSRSFVLPSLDFSSSIHTTEPISPLSVASTPGSEPPWIDGDMFSEFGSISDGSGSWIEPPSVSIARASSNASSSWIGFSSAFTDRIEGPREEVF